MTINVKVVRKGKFILPPVLTVIDTHMHYYMKHNNYHLQTSVTVTLLCFVPTASGVRLDHFNCMLGQKTHPLITHNLKKTGAKADEKPSDAP